MWLELDKKDREWLLNNLPDCKEGKRIRSKLSNMRGIKPRSAKNKGLAWQKEVCGYLSAMLGIPYNQQDDGCPIHSRESGLSGCDIILRGEARERFDYAIECKAVESIHLAEWVQQAMRNTDENDWMLFIKNRRVGKIVCMTVDALKKIYKG